MSFLVGVGAFLLILLFAMMLEFDKESGTGGCIVPLAIIIMIIAGVVEGLT